MIGRLGGVAALSAVLAGCATTPDSCRRIGLALGSGVQLPAPQRASVPELSCGADLGIQGAALELARRYENGLDVASDQHEAARLYMRAATPANTTTQVYSPPVRLGGRGQVLVLPSPNAEPGSAEAQYRLALMRLEGRGIVKSPERAERLLRLAAAQGHEEAAKKLKQLEAAAPQL